MELEKLIVEYFEGQLDEAGKEVLFNEIKKSEENKSHFYAYKLIWEKTAEQKWHDNYSTEHEWLKTSKKLNTGFESSRKTMQFKRWVQYAAIMIFGLLLGFLIINTFQNKQQASLANNEIYVPKGQKSQLTLSDGTKIWLNAETHLVYPNSFNHAQTREVTLEGEAYFEVATNEKIPFIVQAGKLHIKVLGTSFNVKSYPDEQTIETTLIEGKVSLNSTTQPSGQVILNPSEKAVFSKSNQNIKIEPLGIAAPRQQKPEAKEMASTQIPDISWKEEVLHFNNNTFGEIVKKLERWYGYQIVVKNEELLLHRYQGKFANLESITQVLDAIGLTTPIKYTIENKKIIIEKK
jgi:transmembrane sensor